MAAKTSELGLPWAVSRPGVIQRTLGVDPARHEEQEVPCPPSAQALSRRPLRQLRDTVSEASSALKTSNHPPVFQRMMALVRIIVVKGGPRINLMSENASTAIWPASSSWVRVTEEGIRSVHPRDGDFFVYLMKADGTDVRKLTQGSTRGHRTGAGERHRAGCRSATST